MRENKKLGFSSVKFTRVRNTDVRGSAKLAGRLAGEAGWLRGFERRHGPCARSRAPCRGLDQPWSNGALGAADRMWKSRGKSGYGDVTRKKKSTRNVKKYFEVF